MRRIKKREMMGKERRILVWKSERDREDGERKETVGEEREREDEKIQESVSEEKEREGGWGKESVCERGERGEWGKKELVRRVCMERKEC